MVVLDNGHFFVVMPKATGLSALLKVAAGQMITRRGFGGFSGPRRAALRGRFPLSDRGERSRSSTVLRKRAGREENPAVEDSAAFLCNS